jgi:hypothetical protein
MLARPIERFLRQLDNFDRGHLRGVCG